MTSFPLPGDDRDLAREELAAAVARHREAVGEADLVVLFLLAERGTSARRGTSGRSWRRPRSASLCPRSTTCRATLRHMLAISRSSERTPASRV